MLVLRFLESIGRYTPHRPRRRLEGQIARVSLNDFMLVASVVGGEIAR
jgi:hypothetical protein